MWRHHWAEFETELEIKGIRQRLREGGGWREGGERKKETRRYDPVGHSF